MKRLFIFDMDGTLLPNTTAMIQIAEITGHGKELAILEKEYLDKEIDNHQFAKKLYDLWKDLSIETIREAFNKTPKLKNIEKGLRKIKKGGGIPCLITAAPEFFANHFLDSGFEFIFASKPFNLTERRHTPESVLHAKDKPVLAARLCERLNLDFRESAAFGDSHSDIPLFKALTHTVSVNGDAHIMPFAKHHYNGQDLMEILDLLNIL